MQYGMTCPTPMNVCRGAALGFGNGSNKTKWHQTAADVLRCYGKHLESEGWQRVSSREYRWPDGSKPRMILSKQPGVPVISGKRSDKQTRGRPMGVPHKVKAF